MVIHHSFVPFMTQQLLEIDKSFWWIGAQTFSVLLQLYVKVWPWYVNLYALKTNMIFICPIQLKRKKAFLIGLWFQLQVWVGMHSLTICATSCLFLVTMVCHYCKKDCDFFCSFTDLNGISTTFLLFIYFQFFQISHTCSASYLILV